MTPALVLSKLYANTIYMVLNSRFRIIGGRDIYTSFYRYGDYDHYDEGYYFPFNAGRTANHSGRDN